MMTTEEILTGIKNWVVGKLNLKQNVISDLADIRSGAQAGATSVQPADVVSYFDNAVYDSGTHKINFYHGQSVIAYIDASPFIVDGMVDDVRIENGYLVIDFNTASGKQDISIPLTDIFNPNNYYTKSETDSQITQKQSEIDDLYARIGYYVCSTEGNVAAKTIVANNYTLGNGGSIKVKMTNANTVDNATLNINSTGTKALYYAGERASASNTWEAGETVEIYYDGTSFYANNVAGGSGSGDGAFDVSVKYPTSGVDGGNTYTLEGALSVLNTNLSASKKKGGMSIKFIQSPDNKYVQYRLTTDEFSTDVADWEQSASLAQLEELEDNVVMTGSYDATVAVGLADNLRGDTVVNAEFYKRKTGGTQSVGSGIAAIKEVRGKSIVWNQLIKNGNFSNGVNGWSTNRCTITSDNNICAITLVGIASSSSIGAIDMTFIINHVYLVKFDIQCDSATSTNTLNVLAAVDAFVSRGIEYNDNGGVKNVSFIRTASKTATGVLSIYPNANQMLPSGSIIYVSNVMCIDLTLMFGAGNEPATVAEFEKMFPLDYYDYNACEVIPFAGQNLTTTGKNQYNPATGKANLLGGQTYQIGGTYTSAEIDGVAVTLDSNDCFTTTNDCVLDVTGGNNEDTFVGLYNGETNIFEPYEKHTLPLDPSQWRDKNGDLVFPYGGMHGVGTAYDYAKVDADGYIRKAVRLFGSADLGSLNWLYNEQNYYFYTSDVIKCKGWSTSSNKPNYISSKFVTTSYNKNSDNTLFSTYISTSKDIGIKSVSYGTNTASFKAAMQGVPLIYELAEPVEVELSTPVYAKYLVDKDGTEEITPANGTTPYTTMANLSILYAMDARGEIKNLPNNYLSKESAENMLSAMVSAGIIASYTMTYDAANARYQFTIVAPTQSNE